jgi:steroid 5-alpha reductase family enzyme
MISSLCALYQLTSSQQALPNCLPSQGLYALLLMRVGAGVRSLSARSFKVRHGMRGDGRRVGKYVPVLMTMVSKVLRPQSSSNNIS